MVRAGQGCFCMAHLWGGPINISTPPRRRMFRLPTRCCACRHENANEPRSHRCGAGVSAARGRAWDERGARALGLAHALCHNPMPYPLQPASQPATRPATPLHGVWLSVRQEFGCWTNPDKAGESWRFKRTLCVRTRTNALDKVCPGSGRVRGWPKISR